MSVFLLHYLFYCCSVQRRFIRLKICSIVSCLTGNSALACSFIASECWRHYLYVCSLHSQADPLFYVRGVCLFLPRVSANYLAAVGKLRLPKGFTISLSITLRYFPTMGEEWNSIKDAMALRGIPVTAAGILRHPMRTMEYVYVPMLVSASKISDEITQAAITRGIDHVQRRTCMETVRFHVMDMLVLVAYITVILLRSWQMERGGSDDFFKNVSFSYDGQENNGCIMFLLRFPKGQCVLLCGKAAVERLQLHA